MMRGISPHALGSSQVASWFGSGDVVIPSRAENPWLWSHPLDSTTGLTSNGVGTWNASGGGLAPTFSDQTNPTLRTDSTISTGFSVHVAQVEFKVSSEHLSGGTESWIGLGFISTAFGAGPRFGAVRRFSGNQLSWLAFGVSWSGAAAWTPTADTWYTLRLTWDDNTDDWTLGIDGTGLLTGYVEQTESALTVAVSAYRNGTSPTFTVRNLRYWGGQDVSDAPPW